MVDDKERDRLVFTITVLANGLVFCIFSAFRVFGNMMGWALDIQIIWWMLFVVVLITVNIWLYYVYYKWPQKQARSASP
jgi:uncharacterized membrane-anchored protein YitT (DUF2179 family)